MTYAERESFVNWAFGIMKQHPRVAEKLKTMDARQQRTFICDLLLCVLKQ